MTSKSRQFMDYAASKKVPSLIAAPLYLRLLWAVGFEVKPSILRKNLMLSSLELSVTIVVIALPFFLATIWPKSRIFFTEPHWCFGTIAIAIAAMLPSSYYAIKGHKKNLHVDWEDFQGRRI